jgi:hypothetical protein
MIRFVLFTSVITAFTFTIAYLALVTYLFGYLNRVHRPTWAELGSPSLEVWDPKNPLESIRSALLSFQFMLTGDQHKLLEDAHLNKVILSIRVTFVIVLTSWAVLLTIFSIGSIANAK